MDAELLTGLDSSHAAIVLIVWIVTREIMLFLKSKGESKEVINPTAKVHGEIHKEVMLVKADIADIKNDSSALVDMHLDADSKFATVHLTSKIEDFERRMTTILQRIELEQRNHD